MEDWTKYDLKLRYMFLSRMKQDCEYYLGYGNRNTDQLWACNEIEDKPEWLTLEELNEYARKMDVDI